LKAHYAASLSLAGKRVTYVNISRTWPTEPASS